MTGRPVPLAGLARIGLVCTIGLAAAGCGQSQPSQRGQLAAYLRNVNHVEADLASPIGSVTRAGAEFARTTGPGGAASRAAVARQTERALTRADGQITVLRRRLAAVPAPAVAHHLRALLLQLVDAQRRLAQSSARLIVFLPAFARDMAPLTPAIQRLEHVLTITQASGATAVQAVYAQKVAALWRFESTLDAMAARLQRLACPQVLRPSYTTQLASVRGMSRSAGRLAAALTTGATVRVPALLAAFDRAAAQPQTLGAQRAQIVAIKAYNRQIAGLGRLSGQAERERLALADRLH